MDTAAILLHVNHSNVREGTILRSLVSVECELVAGLTPHTDIV